MSAIVRFCVRVHDSAEPVRPHTQGHVVRTQLWRGRPQLARIAEHDIHRSHNYL